MFNAEGTSKAKNDRIFRANQWWGRLGSVSRLRSNKYEVCRMIWKAVAVPSLMYGMEVIDWSVGEISRMEVIQNKVGRLALGANRMVGVEAIRGEMGWSSFEERLFKAKLRFKTRLERMGNDRWAHKVYAMTFHWSKWIKACEQVVRKCGLEKVWIGHIGFEPFDSEWRIAQDNISDYSQDEWKVVIKNKVQEYGLDKWRQGIANKSTLSLYSAKEAPRREDCYFGSLGCSLLFKARSGSLETNRRTHWYNEERTKNCQMCSLGTEETIHHLLFECRGFDVDREWAMTKYRDLLGIQGFDLMKEKDDDGLGFILGLDEEAPRVIMEITKVYLGMVWKQRGRCSSIGEEVTDLLPLNTFMFSGNDIEEID